MLLHIGVAHAVIHLTRINIDGALEKHLGDESLNQGRKRLMGVADTDTRVPTSAQSSSVPNTLSPKVLNPTASGRLPRP
jgi:hypothetical protein